MSRADVELVRQLLAPFEQGDIAPIFRDAHLNGLASDTRFDSAGTLVLVPSREADRN